MANMRITERMRFELPQQRIETLRGRTVDASERLSSGKRINRPSDDALGAMQVETLSSQQRRVEQFERNLNIAEANLHQVDGVLAEATDTLLRVKELTIQSLTSVISQEDAETIADEIAGLREHLRSLANTRLHDRYLFAGFAFDTEPYPDGGGFAGTGDVPQVEATEGMRVDTTIPGGQAFGDGTAATVDVFDNLVNLEEAIRGRIAAGVPGEDAVQDELERLEASFEQVVDARSGAGIALNRAEAARGVNAFFAEHLPTRIAEVQDADFPKVVSELQLADNALQATLAASGRMLSAPSLLDFLR